LSTGQKEGKITEGKKHFGRTQESVGPRAVEKHNGTRKRGQSKAQTGERVWAPQRVRVGGATDKGALRKKRREGREESVTPTIKETMGRREVAKPLVRKKAEKQFAMRFLPSKRAKGSRAYGVVDYLAWNDGGLQSETEARTQRGGEVRIKKIVG